MKSLWPIIERELRSLSRSRQTVVTRFAIGFIGIALTLLIAIVDYFDDTPQRNLGAVMLGFQTFFMLVFSIFSCLALTTDTISSEKREGTLGLLYLTDLKTIHIILGKISAGTFVAFLSIVSMIPVMSLSLLYGGVNLGMISKLFLVATNHLILSLVIGVFCSVLFEKPRTTQVSALLVVLGLQFGIPILVTWFESSLSGIWAINAFAQAGVLGAGGFMGLGMRAFSSSFFWGGQIATATLSLVLLLISVWHLSKQWRSTYGEDPATQKPKKKSLEDQPQKPSSSLAPSSSPKKLKIKSVRGGIPLSHHHPLRYIFSHKKPEVGSTIFSMVIFLLYMFFLAESDGFDEAEAGLFGLVLCGMIFKYQWASVIVSMFNRERKEGTLEFLMSTPVKLTNVFSDMRQAGLHDLKGAIVMNGIWQFINLLIVFADGGFNHPGPWIIFFAVIVLLFLDFEAILHSGAWLGLTNTNYSQGFLKTFIWVVCLPTWIFWACTTILLIFLQVSGAMRGSSANDFITFMVLLGAIFAMGWAIYAKKLSIAWMKKYLRIIAALPLNQKISFKMLNQIVDQISDSGRKW